MFKGKLKQIEQTELFNKKIDMHKVESYLIKIGKYSPQGYPIIPVTCIDDIIPSTRNEIGVINI